MLAICLFCFVKVRGQDYTVDLRGVLDVLQPVVVLMLRTQAVNIPRWKIVTWFVRLMETMKLAGSDLEGVEAGGKPSNDTLQKLSKHWEELISFEDNEDEEYCGNFQVILHFVPLI